MEQDQQLCMKIIHCWNGTPRPSPVRVRERLEDLLNQGWKCRMAAFGYNRALIWLVKTGEQRP
jgi:hypothetical protein